MSERFYFRPFVPIDEKSEKLGYPVDWKPVDEWVPNPHQIFFQSGKNTLNLPIHKFYGFRLSSEGGTQEESMKAESLNSFILTTKRCYNGKDMKDHLPLYMNYFEEFYDRDHELITVLAGIKYLIDYEKNYNQEAFLYDIERYILSPSLLEKARAMNEDNYLLNLDEKKYHNDKNPSLTYRDRHAKTLMWMSLLMNMCIPLLTHYIYIHRIANVNGFLLSAFDIIVHLSRMDIYNKLYETCYSNINKSVIKEKTLWDMQSIRGKNLTTQSLVAVDNIILNIMPKYTYDRNNIYFNYVSIKKSNKLQVVDIGYEFDFVALSSSKRDAENNSAFDKYESYLIKQSDSYYLMNKTAAEDAMRNIINEYGPFDKAEIEYYQKRLKDDNGSIINNFQKTLIFLLFMKYFGDPNTINSINEIDYIILMISAFRKLQERNLIILPSIISSKVEKIVTRKSVNKKELERLQSSQFYPKIKEKYTNPKMENQILQMIATILSSTFITIDFYEPAFDNKKISKDDPDPNNIRIQADFLEEEILMYIMMI